MRALLERDIFLEVVRLGFARGGVGKRRVHLGAHAARNLRVLVRGRELARRVGHAAFEPRPHSALVGRCCRREEVGSVGAVHVLQAKSLKVRARFFSWPVVDDLALRDDRHLVEALVHAVSGLVQREHVDALTHIAEGTADLDELQRCVGVQTTRCVVPALHLRVGAVRLCQGHALPLAARHAAHELVADLGVERVGDMERVEHVVLRLGSVLGASDHLAVGVLARTLARRFHAQRKVHRLADREVGVVHLVLGDEGHLAAQRAESLVLGLHAAVVHCAVDAGIRAMVARERFEEGGAA